MSLSKLNKNQILSKTFLKIDNDLF